MSLSPRDVLFVDEIHRLNRIVEESLYPAMEDFMLDVVSGRGTGAQVLRLPLKRFTLIGATTRAALLTGPLRDRFGLVFRLEFYDLPAMQALLERAARVYKVTMEDLGATEIARRSRRTPRVALRLLRRVRDYAQVMAEGIITLEVARDALNALGIDELGLDEMDRRILELILTRFKGGPVGLGDDRRRRRRGGGHHRGRLRAVPAADRLPGEDQPRAHRQRGRPPSTSNLPLRRLGTRQSPLLPAHARIARNGGPHHRRLRLPAPAGAHRPDPGRAPRRLPPAGDPPRTGALEHRRFGDLGEYLRPGDLLVANDSRVLPGRIWARRASGGRVELLLLRPLDDGCRRPGHPAPGGWWEAARPGRCSASARASA